MNHIINCFKKYATFSGRASRAEFLSFCLFVLIFCIPLGFLLKGTNPRLAAPFLILILASTIPSIAVAVRRLHDAGLSSWRLLWLLLPLIGPIILLVHWAKTSQPGDNEYGPNPYGQ